MRASIQRGLKYHFFFLSQMIVITKERWKIFIPYVMNVGERIETNRNQTQNLDFPARRFSSGRAPCAASSKMAAVKREIIQCSRPKIRLHCKLHGTLLIHWQTRSH